MDFENLGMLGWIGILIRIVWVVSIAVKQDWHFSYEGRLIQIRAVDQYVVGEVSEYIYMGLRFVISTIIMFVVTGWMI